MDFNRLPNGEPEGPKIQVEITWKSIFRVLTGVLLAYLAVVLWPVFKLLLLATLLAIALTPLVSAVCRRGWARWVGLSVATAVLVVIVVGCFAVIGPMVYRQALVLGESLPKLKDQVASQLPQSGVIHSAFEKGIKPEALSDSRRFVEQMLILAKTTVGGLIEFVMVLALAVYLMSDGPKVLKWLLVFFPAEKRSSILDGLRQISELVFAYVAGQFVVSALAAVYVFSMLTVLGVPMALLLGIMAGICDILPLIGFVVAVVLMATVGLSVSPATALLVFAFYAPYHLFENIFILPRVYGRKLRLSPVTVPLAIAAGGLIAGVTGAIAALPIVAAYPVVERLWLAPKLEPDTVKEHERSTG